MPTLKRVDGFEVRLFVSSEHQPPHVHVFKAGGECRVLLGDEDTQPRLWNVVGGMSPQDARTAESLVSRFQGEFLSAWRNYHG